MEEKLTGPNHTSWAKSIQQRLQRLGLWGCVGHDPSETVDAPSIMRSSATERRQLGRANREIVEALEPHVLRDLLTTALPSNLWNVLEEKYRDQAYGSVMDKAFEYFDTRYDEAQASVDEHIARMAARVETLALMGFRVSEDMQVMTLLRSLRGSRYAPFVKELRLLPRPPSLASVVEKLCHYREMEKQPPMTDSISFSSAEMTSTWASLAPNDGASSMTSREFTHEIMHAVARAVHSSSIDSSTDSSASTRVLTLEASQWDHCPCTCKGFTGG